MSEMSEIKNLLEGIQQTINKQTGILNLQSERFDNIDNELSMQMGILSELKETQGQHSQVFEYIYAALKALSSDSKGMVLDIQVLKKALVAIK